MDPREVLVCIAGEVVDPVLEACGGRLGAEQLLELAMLAFIRGAVSMQHAPAWAGAMVAAVNADQRALPGKAMSDAAMVKAQVAAWPIAGPAVRR